MTVSSTRSNHPAKLERGEDEDYADYLGRQGDAWSNNPPAAPEGFELIPCDATPRHWPTYTVVDDDFYDGPCPHCSYALLADQHRGCEHSHHRAWRRWKITGKLGSWLYVTGITASGGSWRAGGGCTGCQTLPKFNLHRRAYVLGWRRDSWRCLLKGHHWPAEVIGLGFCGKCLPCDQCGSITAGHNAGCVYL